MLVRDRKWLATSGYEIGFFRSQRSLASSRRGITASMFSFELRAGRSGIMDDTDMPEVFSISHVDKSVLDPQGAVVRLAMPSQMRT
jgi:hypothetical protein